jgi:hypothetical protein
MMTERHAGPVQFLDADGNLLEVETHSARADRGRVGPRPLSMIFPTGLLSEVVDGVAIVGQIV